MHDSTFKPGESCGGFHILELIGCGGVAEVYKAIHPHTRAIAALKCLRLCHASNVYIKEHMLAEAELLLGLHHDNVVRVEDVGMDRGVLWMAMEYLPGMTLRALLTKSPVVPIPTALYYAREIADGLAAIHEMRVVHRDLKPENVIITDQNKVKVLDMGAAKFFGLDIKRTLTGTIYGTPLYMSPEHIQEKPIDARADVYSLGLILYEMLAGRHPFARENGSTLGKYEICERQLRVNPPPLAKVVESFPVHVSDFVQRAIAKNQDMRPSTMSDFAGGVRAHLRRVVEEARALPSLPAISLVAAAPNAAGHAPQDARGAGDTSADGDRSVPVLPESTREEEDEDEDEDAPTVVFQRVNEQECAAQRAVQSEAASPPDAPAERARTPLAVGTNGTEVMRVAELPPACGPEGAEAHVPSSLRSPLPLSAARVPAPWGGSARFSIPPGVQSPLTPLTIPPWGREWIAAAGPLAELRRARFLEESLRVFLGSAIVALTLSLLYSNLIATDPEPGARPPTHPLRHAPGIARPAIRKLGCGIGDPCGEWSLVDPDELPDPKRRPPELQSATPSPLKNGNPSSTTP